MHGKETCTTKIVQTFYIVCTETSLKVVERMQWLMDGASDSQLRVSEFESWVCGVKTLGKCFHSTLL